MFGMIALVIIALVLGFTAGWVYTIIPAVIGVVAAVINGRINSGNKAQRIAAARAVFGDLEILNKL